MTAVAVVRDVGLETAVLVHLEYHLFPAVHVACAQAAVRAVQLASAGRGDELIDLPEQAPYDLSGARVRASVVVTRFHLEELTKRR